MTITGSAPLPASCPAGRPLGPGGPRPQGPPGPPQPLGPPGPPGPPGFGFGGFGFGLGGFGFGLGGFKFPGLGSAALTLRFAVGPPGPPLGCPLLFAFCLGFTRPLFGALPLPNHPLFVLLLFACLLFGTYKS